MVFIAVTSVLCLTGNIYMDKEQKTKMG